MLDKLMAAIREYMRHNPGVPVNITIMPKEAAEAVKEWEYHTGQRDPKNRKILPS